MFPLISLPHLIIILFAVLTVSIVMRNLVLGAVLFSAFVTYGHAQSASLQTTTAEKMSRSQDSTTLSGGVEIVMKDGSRITANRAVFHHASNEVELSGSVRIKLPETNKR